MYDIIVKMRSSFVSLEVLLGCCGSGGRLMPLAHHTQICDNSIVRLSGTVSVRVMRMFEFRAPQQQQIFKKNKALQPPINVIITRFLSVVVIIAL
jgi:hypothetical protein